MDGRAAGKISKQGTTASDAIEPFFVLMRFPGESELEFVSILPFTPANRNNLIGWIAGRSDGDKYGTLRAYRFPKTRFVDGPLQIQARIDQDPQLSSQLTLWNQQGSTVIRGNLLVMPLDDVLLFAEPMYLQAERSPMPELRLVVLATQDRLAYATRFPEALNSFWRATATHRSPPLPPPQQSLRFLLHRTYAPSSNGRIRRLADYQKLTAEGKLGEAGVKLDELKRLKNESLRPGKPLGKLQRNQRRVGVVLVLDVGEHLNAVSAQLRIRSCHSLRSIGVLGPAQSNVGERGRQFQRCCVFVRIVDAKRDSCVLAAAGKHHRRTTTRGGTRMPRVGLAAAQTKTFPASGISHLKKGGNW